MKHGLMCAAALLCLMGPAAALAEVVQAKERTYAVRYKDGAVERYKVAWTANVTTTVREQGGSPVPYQGSVDNRKCSWSIATTIDRTVSLATRQGAALALPGMSRTFREDFRNPGTELVVTGTRNESCKEATAQREGAIAEARGALRALFEPLTEADLQNLKREAQSKPDVAAITVE